MRESGIFHPEFDGSLAANRIPSFGEALADVALNFSHEGALGLIAVDASALAEVERSFGCEAHQRSMNALAALTADLIGEGLGIGDMILSGETGRNEILVLVFRESNEIDFYRRELPGLARSLVHGYRSRGHRIGYPYMRKTPTLPVGAAAALRNPTIGAETQLRAALLEAREDADLSERIAARRRRPTSCWKGRCVPSTSRSSRWRPTRCTVTRPSRAGRRARSCSPPPCSSRAPGRKISCFNSTVCVGRAVSTAPGIFRANQSSS
jgi:hypothetical protein